MYIATNWPRSPVSSNLPLTVTLPFLLACRWCINYEWINYPRICFDYPNKTHTRPQSWWYVSLLRFGNDSSHIHSRRKNHQNWIPVGFPSYSFQLVVPFFFFSTRSKMEISSPSSLAITVTFCRVQYKWNYFKIAVLWNEALCGLVEIYRRFRRTWRHTSRRSSRWVILVVLVNQR